ncbi:hypothetical protein GCM10020220_085910 [Nonomuraea rubra]
MRFTVARSSCHYRTISVATTGFEGSRAAFTGAFEVLGGRPRAMLAKRSRRVAVGWWLKVLPERGVHPPPSMKSCSGLRDEVIDISCRQWTVSASFLSQDSGGFGDFASLMGAVPRRVHGCTLGGVGRRAARDHTTVSLPAIAAAVNRAGGRSLP